VEDDVRRHAACARDLHSNGTELLEQILVDPLPRFGLDSRAALLALADDPTLARQSKIWYGRRVLEQLDPFIRQRHDRKLIVGLPEKALGDQLLDIAADLWNGGILQESKSAQRVMAPHRHLFVFAAAEDVRDVRGTEPLPHARDT
jgi:hypothetical protein